MKTWCVTWKTADPENPTLSALVDGETRAEVISKSLKDSSLEIISIEEFDPLHPKYFGPLFKTE